jgi:hypothetical protein
MKVKSAECQVAVYYPLQQVDGITTAPATSSFRPLDKFVPVKFEPALETQASRPKLKLFML